MNRLAAALSLALLSNAAMADAPKYSLTIYSSAQPGQIDVNALAGYGQNVPGYALVRDRRAMTLPQGRGEVRFTDVAKMIDPTTVNFASTTDPKNTRVLEQNYQFDLVSDEKLMDRYIGQRITVERADGSEIVRHEGILLGTRGALLLQTDGGEVLTLRRYDNVRFPSLPGGLITRPTLVWLVDAARGGSHDVEVAYQSRGLTWWADYNIILDERDAQCRMDLAAWVTIVNQSGGSFPQAKLKLVAGEVNRAPAAPQGMVKSAGVPMVAEAMADDGFQESELFEYHLYTLGRPSDLPDQSTKQLELFPAAVGMNCKKELVFTASPYQYPLWGGSPNQDRGLGATHKGSAAAFLEFENREQNRLGVPLPAGRIRVNQASQDGSLEFIGEDLIEHTPRNEKVRLLLGEAFDIAGERRQTDFKIDTNARWMEESFEISVRNRKKVAAEVLVREYLYRWSGWSLTQQSVPSVKRDAQTVDFPLNIPADKEAVVRYTVRYTW